MYSSLIRENPYKHQVHTWVFGSGKIETMHRSMALQHWYNIQWYNIQFKHLQASGHQNQNWKVKLQYGKLALVDIKINYLLPSAVYIQKHLYRWRIKLYCMHLVAGLNILDQLYIIYINNYSTHQRHSTYTLQETRALPRAWLCREPDPRQRLPLPRARTASRQRAFADGQAFGKDGL